MNELTALEVDAFFAAHCEAAPTASGRVDTVEAGDSLTVRHGNWDTSALFAPGKQTRLLLEHLDRRLLLDEPRSFRVRQQEETASSKSVSGGKRGR
jgi:hypothetical protein